MNTQHFTDKHHLARATAIIIPAILIISFYHIRTFPLFIAYLLFAYLVAVIFSWKTNLVKRWLHTGSVILTLFICFSAVLSIKDLFRTVNLQDIAWTKVLLHASWIMLLTLMTFAISWLVYYKLDAIVCSKLSKKA